MYHVDHSTSKIPAVASSGPWYKELTGYHWFVFIVAALGWLADTMDQTLFILARNPAMKELLTVDGVAPAPALIDSHGAYSTSIFIIGWATGGLVFGILGDRIGRAKTMLLTILLYSIFTGLSALSWNVWSFDAFRFLTGLGVGGEFAVGVALLAEVMPDRARPHALGWLQALSAVGNITGAMINISLGIAEGQDLLGDWQPWRWMFVVGALPALLAIAVRWKLKEPEKWTQAVAAGSNVKAGSIRELFSDPLWRKHAFVGLGLAVPGVIGLWGIGFFTPDFLRGVFKDRLSGSEMTTLVGLNTILFNVGGGIGMYSFKHFAERLGRRGAFAIAYTLAIIATVITFWVLNEYYQVFFLIPVLGFCQMMAFGGYAIYFPELFPTRLRTTGISLCYNVGRYIAALGVLTLGQLLLAFGELLKVEAPMHWRYAAITMSSFFLVGLFTLLFAPETKGKPLPD